MKNNNICNFECKVECGNVCCVGGTMLCLDELLYLKDKFVFGLMMAGSNGHPIVEKNFKALGGFTFINGKTTSFNFVSINSTACDMLEPDTHGCKLHFTDNKPIMCQLMPFDPIYLESEQFQIFQLKRPGLKNAGCQGFLSSTDTNHTVFKNTKFTDNKMSLLANRYREQVRLVNNNIIKPIKENLYEELNDIIGTGAYFNNTENDFALPVPFIAYLEIFKYLNLSAEETLDFVACQKKLIENTKDIEKTYANTMKEFQLIILKELEDLFSSFS